MSKRTVTHLALVLAALAALLAAIPAFAQASTPPVPVDRPGRTTVYLDLGDIGPLYSIGVERQLGQNGEAFFRVAGTVLPVFVADGGVIVTAPVSVGRVIRPFGGRLGLEAAMGFYPAYYMTGTQVQGPTEHEFGIAAMGSAAVRWDPRQGRWGARFGSAMLVGAYGISRPHTGLAVTYRVSG